MKTITPLKHQKSLPLDQLILTNPSPVGEAVPMDVVFVGAGPAGLTGAIRLAQLIKKDNENGGTLGDIQIGVLEKAANLGGHTLSGAVMNPKVIRELFPELADADLPLRKKVAGDRVYMLTPSGQLRLPTPPPMHNDGNYVVSLCEVVRFLGQKAEELGINIFTSFPADSILTDGKMVQGVRTTPAGLMRDSSPGSQYMPPNDITAKITVLADGTRSALAQAYCAWQKINSEQPQIYALGVKEIWKVKKAPLEVTHTLGYPLPTDAFGGSWMYPLADDMISFGLVVGLDYKSHSLDTHKLLQKLKSHPLFKQYLDGGEIVEWGAKTIPEGGWNSLPKRMHGDGLLMTGDAVGLVNVPALKGIHYAMQSGVFAAETAFDALKKNDFSAEALSTYDSKIKNSFIKDDLYKVRNMRQAFKSGFYLGGIKASLMTATAGLFPGGCGHSTEDAAEEKRIDKVNTDSAGLSKVDAVYLSGNKTRDDIPQHLTVGTDISGDVADMYAALCPAGVYERQGDKLIVNAPNCIDCKATDVIGPRWQPREGGSGPDYKLM
ncbi:MAG: 4Fe-4S dicluster domain-containing protein [Bdellovibrionales bacterium]|nr:4Fe-4S dicluster domain-containing protein [Bdellovibrionales bacterium]